MMNNKLGRQKDSAMGLSKLYLVQIKLFHFALPGFAFGILKFVLVHFFVSFQNFSLCTHFMGIWIFLVYLCSRQRKCRWRFLMGDLEESDLIISNNFW